MPVLFATANGIHLETPSEMTKAVVKEAEDKVMSLPEHERRSDALKVWSGPLVGWGRVLCLCKQQTVCFCRGCTLLIQAAGAIAP